MKNLLNSLANYWKTGKNGKLIIIIIGLSILICLCCGAMFALGSALPDPTLTPTLTQTNTPSSTSTLTPTSTQTFTPTPTLTNTPVPPATQTAQAYEATQTQNANNATATRSAYYMQSTATALAKIATLTQIASNSTATRIALNDQRTATALAYSARATEIAQYKDIFWQELTNYADQHIGEKVRITIRIFNIISDTKLQGYFGGTYEAVVVEMRVPYSGLYEETVIVVYGTVEGEYCGTNAFGGTICQPMLTDAFYEKP